jgi:hypothetical protein
VTVYCTERRINDMMRDFLKTKLSKKQLQSALKVLQEFQKCCLEGKDIDFQEFRVFEEFEKALVYLTEGTLSTDDVVVMARQCLKCGKAKDVVDIEGFEPFRKGEFPESMLCQCKEAEE